MKGYPKTLNSKADYEYVRKNFPEDQWKKDWRKLLDSEKDWYADGEVKSLSAGLTDGTHKVTEEVDEETGETKYEQWELKVNPTCKLLRLGFTEEEVKSALG